VLVPLHAQRCSFCLHAGLPRCLDDRTPRRHIHSIPLQQQPTVKAAEAAKAKVEAEKAAMEKAAAQAEIDF
jgi:hypothetical protein